MEKLCLVLWRERELLDTLLYRLEVEQLVLARNRTEHLMRAARDVEAVLEDVMEKFVTRETAEEVYGVVLTGSADDGTLEALVDAAEWDAREQATPPPQEMGVGRELFAMLRHHSDPAEKGGSAMLAEAGL